MAHRMPMVHQKYVYINSCYKINVENKWDQHKILDIPRVYKSVYHWLAIILLKKIIMKVSCGHLGKLYCAFYEQLYIHRSQQPSLKLYPENQLGDDSLPGNIDTKHCSLKTCLTSLNILTLCFISNKLLCHLPLISFQASMERMPPN